MTFVYVLLGIVAILVLVVIVLAMGKPDEFEVERSAVIQAPASRIFARINDLAAWRAWSPWEKKDPNMQRELSAVTAGVGAFYGWKGNKDVGRGKMTIIESSTDSGVLIKLDFHEPFESTSDARFTLTSEGTGTRVHWAMTGKSNFISKIMCVFMNMDKMIGPDFEAGLAELKKQSESP